MFKNGLPVAKPLPINGLHESQPGVWLIDGWMRHQLEDVIFLSDTK